MSWDFGILFQSSFIVLCTVFCAASFLLVNKTIPKDIKKYFWFVLVCLLVEALEGFADHTLSTVPDNRYELYRIFVSIIGYVNKTALLYFVLLIMTRKEEIKHRKLYIFIPCAISIIVGILALFTPYVFSYDANNNFHAGPLRNIFYLDVFAYIIMATVANIKKIKEDGQKRFTVWGIIFLLYADFFITAITGGNPVHEHMCALEILFYFMYFTSVFNSTKVEELQTEISTTEEDITKRMLDQVIETLAYAVDAKDEFTRGHSQRVAKYARKLAELDGRSEEECRDIYLAGLLHDIGKIAVDDAVIKKRGKFTAEEYNEIKTHAEKGGKILERMRDYPILQQAAKYHHEHYDGTGYPEGLLGENIPEIARIIAVADAYDAMTSYRSYRDSLDQADVKQELWKGNGSQFDPHFAKLMISLIDSDVEYDMREKEDSEEDKAFDLFETDKREITWGTKSPAGIKEENQIMHETDIFLLGVFSGIVNNWTDPVKAVKIGSNGDHGISFHSVTDEGAKYLWFVPTAIIFGSDDGVIGSASYDELGVFVGTGYSWPAGSTLSEESIIFKKPAFGDWDNWIEKIHEGLDFTASAKRNGDTVEVTLENELLRIESVATLPSGYRKNIYITVTAERCNLSNFAEF